MLLLLLPVVPAAQSHALAPIFARAYILPPKPNPISNCDTRSDLPAFVRPYLHIVAYGVTH